MITARPQTLAGTYDYISQMDSAVDRDVENFKELWGLYEYGKGQPPLKPGQQPTVFKLRHLTHSDERYLAPFIDDAKRAACLPEAMHRVCRVVIVSVENFRDSEGGLVAFVAEETDGRKMCAEKCVDRLPQEVIYEIAAVALNRRHGDPL